MATAHPHVNPMNPCCGRALVGEVGELCEIFQWKGEVQPGLPGWAEKDRSGRSGIRTPSLPIWSEVPSTT